jgi:hypothetical protein
VWIKRNIDHIQGKRNNIQAHLADVTENLVSCKKVKDTDVMFLIVCLMFAFI